jgi:flavin-dependent dehydrogenase
VQSNAIPKLGSGSRIAVIGGGPSGSFSSYFLHQIAWRIDAEIHVDIYEPREFECTGPKSCNMCGGIVSESLLMHLAAEGINLPAAVIQRRLGSYFLHMDVGSVRIRTPELEKRIAAVHRGSGPRGCADPLDGFDAHILKLAREQGANVIQERVTGVTLNGGRPTLKTGSGESEPYDLLVVATGINTAFLKLFEKLETGYRPPKLVQASICEFRLGRWMIERHLGNAMHVFLLNIPRLEFAALIPKGEYVTLVLLGDDIDKELMLSFLEAPEVKACMPPDWKLPDDYCHCSPRMPVVAAVKPYGDRVVFVGDCGTSRLYKDGIGADYRMAKAMSRTAFFHGVSEQAFHKHFRPACNSMINDNRIGKFVFWVTGFIQKFKFLRRAVWRMASREQQIKGARPRMSTVLWDTFTGSASYMSVLRRTLHPAYVGRLGADIATAVVQPKSDGKNGRNSMPSNVTGFMGKKYKDGEVIYHQGERGDCMYVVQEGEVELVQRQEDKEFCLSTMKKRDIFGENVIFNSNPVRQATARAVGDIYVLTLEKDMLLTRLHEDPSLAFTLLQSMSQRIQNLESTVVRMSSAS